MYSKDVSRCTRPASVALGTRTHLSRELAGNLNNDYFLYPFQLIRAESIIHEFCFTDALTKCLAQTSNSTTKSKAR